MKKIAIYGAGGLGKEALTIIQAINEPKIIWDFIGYFDDGAKGADILGGGKELNRWKENLHVIIAVGNPLVKRDIYRGIKNNLVNFPALVHPRAIISDAGKVQIGDGAIVTAGVIMTADIKVGKHALINLNATIGHDTIVGDYCSIMPGVNLAGKVCLGECVLAGTGAIVLNGINIGPEAKIGAGAMVNRDVLKNTTVVGVPARPLKL